MVSGREWPSAGPLAPVRWTLPVLASAVAAVTLLPIGYVVGQTADVGGHRAMALLLRPRVGELLVNTVELLLCGTLACVALGVGAAWLVECTDLRARTAWATLLSIPLAVPAFIRGFSWISLLPSVHGLDGALVIVSLSYYPLVFLPVRAALQGLDPALDEAARSLGAGRWRRFARVTLPQIRGALCGGALLVALDLLAEFGAFSMLRFATFTTAIYDQYRAAFDTSAGAVLALALVTLCLPLLGAEWLLRGRTRRARVGSGSPRPPERHRLGRAQPVALAGVAAVVLLSLGVPLASIGYWLMLRMPSAIDRGDLVSAAMNTLSLGLAGAFVTLLFAFPVALLATRRRSRWTTVLERTTYLPHALPGIVVALALITMTIRFVPSAYQSRAVLISGYAILFLPRAMIALRAALEKAPPQLEEAARSLGKRPLPTLWWIAVPLTMPGIGAGGALVFLSVTTELTMTLLLAPIGTQTLATGVWAHTSTLTYPAAAPYAALIIVVTIPAMLLITRYASAHRVVTP
jgi:iron(III) transport system permease protein